MDLVSKDTEAAVGVLHRGVPELRKKGPVAQMNRNEVASGGHCFGGAFPLPSVSNADCTV